MTKEIKKKMTVYNYTDMAANERRLKSSIIGHFRNGATNEMIALIVDMTPQQVERIIKDYLANK